MSVPRFIATFLGVFAILIAVGGPLGLTRGYAKMLGRTAALTSPAVNGWWLEERASTGKQEIWLRKGDREVRLQIGLEKLALGLFPLVSLILATPGLVWKRYALAVTAGVAGLFAIDLIVLLAYPQLVQPGAVNDIAGTFLGLVAFVAGPVILWFALTFSRLQAEWRLRP